MSNTPSLYNPSESEKFPKGVYPNGQPLRDKVRDDSLFKKSLHVSIEYWGFYTERGTFSDMFDKQIAQAVAALKETFMEEYDKRQAFEASEPECSCKDHKDV